MFEMFSIVCIAAALMQGECLPESLKTQEEKTVVLPNSYEQMITPKAFQLSYSGSGHHFDSAALTAHWKQRATQLCAGNFIGYPVSQTQYPQPGYDAMFSATILSGNRNFNVEAYGVAHCVDPSG